MSATADPPADAIAIVGMACRFPDAADPDTFWRNLVDGRESVRRLDRDALLRAGERAEVVDAAGYVPAGLVLDGHDTFDAAFFGLSPREARVMDPQHRHFLECAWSALEDAGHRPTDVDRQIGVFAGSGQNAYLLRNVLGHAALVQEMGEFLVRHTGNDKDFLATRVSYHLDLRGPSLNVQTACSTSLVALHLACQSLLNGECDLALAGGSTIEVPHGVGYTWRDGEIRSPDGHCRPFDAAAAGTVFGSGCGVVVLRRLADALADGDRIRAVVLGTAINNDGAGKAGYLAPSVDGQAQCIAEAIGVAGIEPSTIGYIEAHGTGTRIGDPIEVAALTQAFGDVPPGRCGIGSVKANIGHLDTAAGVAGVIKVALALERGVLPPTINFTAPNPEIDFGATPFRVVDRPRSWPDLGAPRRAGISSLGVGGTNAHAVLEQAPPQSAPVGPAAPRSVLVVSARTPDAARAAAARLAERLEVGLPDRLDDVAWTLREGRVAFEHRIAVAAADAPSAAHRLRTARPVRAASGPLQLVFAFPGQGSQQPGMGRELYRVDADYRVAFDRGLDGLRRLGRGDVIEALHAEPGDAAAGARLRDTRITQPALFCVAYAMAQALLAKGLRPAALVGHSLGELVAACLAGVFELDAALALVCRRGELIAGLPAGRMVAVPLSRDAVEPLLGEGVAVAAVNAPEQCVCAGPPDAMAAFEERLRALGHAARPLETSHAFHSAMLDPILPAFRDAVIAARPRAVDPSRGRILSTLDGDWLDPARAASADYWVAHLRRPVDFAGSLARLRDLGPTMVVDVGPGRTMATLVAAALPEARVVAAAPDPRQADTEIDGFFGLAGALWTHGAPVDWTAWRQPTRGRRVPLPTYPFEARRHWLDRVHAAVPVEPAAQPASPGRRDPAQAVQGVDWRLAPPAPPAAPRPRILVLADRHGVGAAAAAALQAGGATVTVVGPLRADAEAGGIDDLLAGLAPGLSQVICCAPLDIVRGDAAGARTLVFDAPLWLAQRAEALAGAAADLELVLVTAQAQAAGGHGAVDPAQALVAGVARTVDRELTGVRARWIDLDAAASRRPADAGALLAQEACASDAPPLVAWRGGRRLRPAFVDLPLSDTARPALRPGGTYLVTGAWGGVGRALARHLAVRWRAHLVLVSRRAVPPAAQREACLAAAAPGDPLRARILWVRQLERHAARVDTVAADVADGDGLLDALRALGVTRLDGVFHAAGTLDDGPMATKTLAAAHRVLHPKVGGVLGLQRLLALQPQFMLHFSSVSARIGAPGQVDYTAANAFVDAWAEAAEADLGETRQVSIGLGPLRDAGMAHAHAVGRGLAVGLPADADPVDHPLLTAMTRPSPSGWAVHGLLAADTCWMLDQHRLRSGAAILPATAFLDLVAIAWRAGGGTLPWCLRDATLSAPLVLEGRAQCLLSVAFERLDAGRVAVRVSSRRSGDTEPLDHVTATLHSGMADVAPLPPAADDPVAVDEPVRHPLLVFGPQWACLSSMEVGARDARLTLALPDPTGLQDHPLHAALLDIAVGGAQGRLGAGLDLASLVPSRYGVLEVRAALPGRIVSRVHGRVIADALHLDVDIEDEAGSCLVRVRDLVLRPARLGRSPRAVTASASAPGRPAATPLAHEDGLSEPELIRAVERVLAHRTPAWVAVAAHDLADFAAAVRAHATAPAAAPGEAVHRMPRPAIDTVHAAPAGAVETAIAAAWEAVLEIAGIGADDDFFELGGHSLLLTRLLSRLRRDHQIDIPLEPAFATPTIRAWAAVAAIGRATPSAPTPIRRIDRHSVRVPSPPAPR
jgi:phthiocerol/phenolphthiocerol synthesis type-I polyketide synthase E